MSKSVELGFWTKVGLSAAAAEFILTGCGVHGADGPSDTTSPVGAPPPDFRCESHLRNGDKLDVTVNRVNPTTDKRTQIRQITEATVRFAGDDNPPQILHPDADGSAQVYLPSGYLQPDIHAIVGQYDPIPCQMNDIRN